MITDNEIIGFAKLVEVVVAINLQNRYTYKQETFVIIKILYIYSLTAMAPILTQLCHIELMYSVHQYTLLPSKLYKVIQQST